MVDSSDARCRIERWPAGVRLWESAQPGESSARVAYRHARARAECLRCPLLEACESALSDMEVSRLPVDGVMAARYSDVGVPSEGKILQDRCLVCGHQMAPQGGWGAMRMYPTTALRHVGQGLCNKCWPGNHRPPAQKPRQPRRDNHPFPTHFDE